MGDSYKGNFDDVTQVCKANNKQYNITIICLNVLSSKLLQYKYYRNTKKCTEHGMNENENKSKVINRNNANNHHTQ